MMTIVIMTDDNDETKATRKAHEMSLTAEQSSDDNPSITISDKQTVTGDLR